MRIKSVHLNNYKRFTNLQICNIPENVRLVVMIGPNGSGKSCLFDAFLHKAHGIKTNYSLDRNRSGYYVKDESVPGIPKTTHDVWNKIKIEMHSTQPTNNEWKRVFNVRSAYRNESDFQTEGLTRLPPLLDTVRFPRIIDVDQSVSDNYKRLAWKRMADLDKNAPANTTFGQYRQESLGELQRALEKLFREPLLQLSDFGGIGESGVFRFNKGATTDFHYKNLSGGEKSAFDILLDIFVTRNDYQDSVYCIDEPEAHIATALHGPLLEAILHLIPKQSQLWIATHSSGFVRKAHDILKSTENVAFIDFSTKDFDKEIKMEPCIPNRRFWKDVYHVSLDDLSTLIAPANIVICEGGSKQGEGFDASCYNKLFADTHPDTLFISHGGAREVENSENLMAILNAVATGIKVWRLLDRDNMSEGGRKEKIKNEIRVLRRREIENYLYDPEVLRTFLKNIKKEYLAEDLLRERSSLLKNYDVTNEDVKSITRKLFEFIRKTTSRGDLGNTRNEFAVEYLVPALKETPDVFEDIQADIFP